ncbi:unnamed protein product [Bubo scandiacus]
MSGSIASYDQLVRQVEALKKENSHLRRELEDNSNHLSKLENETSDMKEVLKHLQGKLEQEARVMVSSGQTEVLDQLKALQMDITSLYNLKFPAEAAGGGRGAEDTPLPPAPHRDGAGDLGRASLRLLEELDRERCFLLGEIEKEEKEKIWYYAQLQSLATRLDELPHVETFSMQMDLIRQQLEFEAQHIRTLMEERFGTADEMVQRAQIRASRLEQIDKELMEAQDKVQQPEPQLCGKVPGVEGDGSLEPPTHPEEGGSSLGSSKVEVVFWLLSMLATRDKDDMSRTLLAMSSSQESCLAMRKSGCLPLLIQILHDSDGEPGPPESPAGAKDARMRANAALHNIVFSQPDEGQAKKEMRVLHVLEQIRSYSETCWDWLQMQSRDGGRGPEGSAAPVPIEPQICQATCAIMKLSFDEEYRRAMNELGGLQAVAELLQVDYEMHKMTSDPLNLALRRYAGMALTNLTFGDVVNKATLCSRRGCMEAIVAQLGSDSEELHQVVSSILRNLSWRADINSKKVLREVGSVTGLTRCALHAGKESTLKSVLSALWNLSAHSTENKAAICGVEGALGFLVSTLTYKCQSNSLAIIESGGGILRNVSSLIATREDYRQVLRDHNCLQTLLGHLRSHSLTIVSNACGTLWNLSARSPRDQELLWDLGAVSMLRNLIHSKHKMIAMGSAAALRNLLTNRPPKYKDAAVVSPGSCMPSLYVRKQKALEAELDAKHLAETFDTMEKQSLKSQSVKKPTRHMESLVKDYASDSGCFDDDEVPNISTGVETASASVLSMFLNSSFLQGQALPRALAQRRCPEPEKDGSGKPAEPKKPPLPEDDVSLAAEKLANKISSTVAKIDKLVEDISTMHTSSDDSFSLSSEDHCLDWQYGPEELPAHPPATAEQESVQKYSVEDTPICFSRCSSLSSLSSADNVLDGQSHSENDLDSDSSLEILEMEEGDGEGEDGRQEKEKAADPGLAMPVGISQPITIPFPKRDKVFLRESSPSRQEDLTPSSSSENYIQETPLVMSRCSSVSSLGSFESPSIASSIQSDPCSEMISGTISPSELPDSPGQTMPPSRSKTPLFELGCQPEKETSQFNIQWENNVKKFMEITDFKERFQLPQDLDSMVYFTVEKPNENFSCASSLSALPLHEHYVQKDVELKLMPTFPEKNSLNFAAHEKREERREERYLEGRRRADRPEPPSDDDIEILKECISSAMPSRFRKVKTSLLSGQVLHPQTKKPVHVPVYMLVPAHAHPSVPKHLRATARDLFKDDDSFTDSADGTPVNFSSAASLSDETLRYPAAEEAEHPRGPGPGVLPEGHREAGSAGAVPARRAASGSSAPGRLSSACKGKAGSSRGQGGEGKRGQPPPKSEPSLELEVGRSSSSPGRKDAPREDGVAFQSLCHTTPTEEAVYCFYEQDSDELPEAGREVPGSRAQPGHVPRRERWGGSVPRRDPEPGPRPAKAKPQNNLIADETPPCYSLSSSMSSLSDANLSDGEERGQPCGKTPRPRSAAAAGQAQGGSPSSPSLNSEDDLLQKCIGSAMPKRRRPSARRRMAERKQKPPAAGGRERKAEARHRPAEDTGSDHGSDLDSVEWQAIQEGANSIVTWLHQAAASLSREPSSESDSILSFMSGLSVGSTLQLSLGRQEKQRASSAAGRDTVRREHSKGRPERKDAPGARPAGRGSARAEQSPAPTKPVPNLPVVFRGRTVIYMPSLAKDAPSPRATLKKSPTAKPEAPPAKNLSLSQQRSRSLHRLGKPPETGDLALPKRSTTPPARIGKGPPSSGSSRTSTPSQHGPKKLPSPSQLAKPAPPATGKAGSSSSPPGPPARAPAPKQSKTQKSPVRIPFMQKPSRKVLPGRGAMPVLEEQADGGKVRSGRPAGPGGSRLNLVRMSSTRSSGSDSDRSGFLRQLTFIKESSSLLLRHRTELSPAQPATSLPRRTSPQRSRAALPAVFLCSSRCEELKAAKPAAPGPRPLIPRAQPGGKVPAGVKPPRRTSSESPSRLPVKTNIPAPEPFKRYSSSPNISVVRRTGSPSSVLSARSEASARRQQSETVPGGQPAKPPVVVMKGTWRRIRDEDIPHILKSTLPSSALPLAGAGEEERPGTPGPRKTSDAVVQTEDFSTTKTNSSTSPTLESREGPPHARAACDGEAPAPAKAALPISFGHEAPAGTFPASRHGSPSRAARVTPFNYVPSPMVVTAVADKAVEKIQA